MKPAVFIQGLCSPLWVFQVTFEHIFSLNTYLEKNTYIYMNKSTKTKKIKQVHSISKNKHVLTMF